MRRSLPLALLFAAASAAPLHAQSFWNSQVRTGPQFYSYDIKAPFNEKISQVAFPVFFVVPVLPQLTVDIGTAFATVNHQRGARPSDPSDRAGSDPQNNKTAPPSSSSTTRADVRRLTTPTSRSACSAISK